MIWLAHCLGVWFYVSCLLGPFFLLCGPLPVCTRRSNMGCTSFQVDSLASLALLLLKFFPGLWGCLHHDGATGIDCVDLCPHLNKLLLHLIQRCPQLVDFRAHLKRIWCSVICIGVVPVECRGSGFCFPELLVGPKPRKSRSKSCHLGRAWLGLVRRLKHLSPSARTPVLPKASSERFTGSLLITLEHPLYREEREALARELDFWNRKSCRKSPPERAEGNLNAV